MDDNTDLLLKYAKQNNDFLRAIYIFSCKAK